MEKTRLETSLKETQSSYDDHQASVQNIIDSKSKEMKNILLQINEVEDQKHNKSKRILAIDAELKELKLERERLVMECSESDEKIKKFSGKKDRLEKYISQELTRAKSEGNVIEEKICGLKNKIEEIEKEMQNFQPNETMISKQEKDPGQNSQLLNNMNKIMMIMNKQIDEKEKALECPVCLEIASVPIFGCSELHLICSNCCPKIKECPVCRTPLKGKMKRHRFAEETAEELVKLKQQVSQLSFNP